MRVLFCTIVISVFAICFFLNEFKWKTINPNGFVKSSSEQHLLIKTIRNNEKAEDTQTEKTNEYSFLDINVKSNR